MKVREIFGLILRVIFVLIAVYGLMYVTSGVGNSLGMTTGTEGTPLSQCAFGGIVLLVSIVLLWLTPRIVRMTYPPEQPPKN